MWQAAGKKQRMIQSFSKRQLSWQRFPSGTTLLWPTRLEMTHIKLQGAVSALLLAESATPTITKVLH